jgi:hypothetical protein
VPGADRRGQLGAEGLIHGVTNPSKEGHGVSGHVRKHPVHLLGQALLETGPAMTPLERAQAEVRASLAADGLVPSQVDVEALEARVLLGVRPNRAAPVGSPERVLSVIAGAFSRHGVAVRGRFSSRLDRRGRPSSISRGPSRGRSGYRRGRRLRRMRRARAPSRRADGSARTPADSAGSAGGAA